MLKLNDKPLIDIVPELRKLSFVIPKKLSDIFGVIGLELTETVRIKAYGNAPNLAVYIYKLKKGIIKNCLTISQTEMINKNYYRYALSKSLNQVLDRIYNRYVRDMIEVKTIKLPSFRVIKAQPIKYREMILCPLREKPITPLLCEDCFYFIQYILNGVTCQYSENEQNIKRKRIRIK